MGAKISTALRPRVTGRRRGVLMSEFFDILALSEERGFSIVETLEAIEKQALEPGRLRWLAYVGGPGVVLVLLGLFLAASGIEGAGEVCWALGGVLLGCFFLIAICFGRTFTDDYAGILARLLRASIVQGNTLSEAMRKRRAWFHPHEILMAQVGERVGRLDLTLSRLSRFAPFSPLRDASWYFLLYFTVIVSFSSLILALIFVFIMPKITEILASLGAPLPPWTQGALSASQWLVHHAYLGVCLAFGLLLFFLILGSGFLGTGRPFSILARIPLLDRLLLKRALARFFFTLGCLLQARVPLPGIMTFAGASSGHWRLGRLADRVGERIGQGESLSHALESEAVVPARLRRILRLAEQNETVPERCLEISHWLQEDAEHRALRIVAVLEPVSVLVWGALVGCVVAAVYLPLFFLPMSIP
ncbi:MAG TPA: type II secretion system F family protein [Sumerlaeia bacterium]|nr:type II secretion system F family protein [Sumerlaeia bacterium]